MVFCKSQLSSFAATALLAVAQASYLANDLSFGHVGGKISPNLRAIPNFHITGNPNPPEILSNKLILTPPAPGNQRGAIWAEKPLKNSEWTADIDFRTTGPERGGGNLQIWYTKDGQSAIGTSSIYTAGKFDGLALVIDQYSGSGGFIRGFLNDGSTTYKDHHSVDSLAFGHCEYSYRNLGRPSRISVKHHSDTFRVEVDGRVCFDSHKVKLPLGYQFGISAASTENPDSFEVFKFVVTTESHTPDVHETEQVGSQQILQDSIPDSQNAQAQRPPPVQQSQPNQQNQVGDIPSFSDPPEVPASSIKSNDAQFADLHNRLQAMMKHIGALNREISSYQNEAREKNSQLSTQITLLSSSLEKLDGLKAMEKKLDHITYDLKQTKSDLHNSLDRHVAGVKSVVGDHHENLMANVVASAPSIVAYTIVVLASQGLLILAFLLYKRRKANGPKKYL